MPCRSGLLLDHLRRIAKHPQRPRFLHQPLQPPSPSERKHPKAQQHIQHGVQIGKPRWVERGEWELFEQVDHRDTTVCGLWVSLVDFRSTHEGEPSEEGGLGSEGGVADGVVPEKSEDGVLQRLAVAGEQRPHAAR